MAPPSPLRGTGNGPIDAFVDGLARAGAEPMRVLDYHEHAIGFPAPAPGPWPPGPAHRGRTLFGGGIDPDIVSGFAQRRSCRGAADRLGTEDSRMANVGIASRLTKVGG